MDVSNTDHDGEEQFADKDRGYDGTREPIQIEDIEHGEGSVVVSGTLQSGGHLITAEGNGTVVVNPANR